MDKLENEKQLLEKQIKELLTTTKSCIFTGTDDELKAYIDDFQTRVQEKEETNLQNKLVAAEKELHENFTQKNKLMSEITILETKYANYEEKKSLLTKIIQQLKETYNKSELSDISNTEEICNNLKRLFV